MTRLSRRSLLASLGVAATGLAGCSDDPAPSTATTNAQPGVETATPTPTVTAAETPSATPTATGTPTAAETRTAAGRPVTGPPPGGVDAFDDAVPQFLDEWDLPGATVAVMREGRLAFARGYGYASPARETAVRPDALFRVGSLSKPITAVAVLDLVERGELALDDRAVDILSDLTPDGGPADSRVSEITVRQLLRHTAGLDNRVIGFDPVFSPAEVADERGETPPASAETTVEYVLTRDLGFDPGTDYLYANVGYCVLGRVVEAVTGADYEAHVSDAVLDPLGASRMAIGATRRENLRDDEVRYLSHGTVESPFPDGGEVPRPYGAGVLDEALDADGGWVGSTLDLLRFVRGVDGRSGVPDVLSAETRATMLERPPLQRYEGADQYYGMGWFVNHGRSEPFLWHNGSLPGSYGFLAHFEGGDLTLAALFNGRSPDAQFRRFNARAQQTLVGAFDAVSSWPDRDLFDRFD